MSLSFKSFRLFAIYGTRGYGDIDSERLKTLLFEVKNGELDIQKALEALSALPYEDLGFAKLDHHRDLRTGFPEVVYAEGKTNEQLCHIADSMAKSSSRVLITRASYDAYMAVKEVAPQAKYKEISKTIIIDNSPQSTRVSGVLIMAAGTADIPVAEEAVVTAELMGNEVETLWDVGVAGIHRLLQNVPIIQKSRVIVVVAGMEGALPSVVSGLTSAPVIAVPTSVGYGTNFHGLTALLTMLNACTPGIAVVNVDNGFGGGYMAGCINLLSSKT